MPERPLQVVLPLRGRHGADRRQAQWVAFSRGGKVLASCADPDTKL